MARPTRLTDQTRARLLDLLAAGSYVEAAAGAVGVSRSTFYGWVQRDQAFADEVAQARAEGQARYVGSVVRAAPADWRAAAFMLERQWPERWGPRPRARPAQRNSLF